MSISSDTHTHPLNIILLVQYIFERYSFWLTNMDILIYLQPNGSTATIPKNALCLMNIKNTSESTIQNLTWGLNTTFLHLGLSVAYYPVALTLFYIRGFTYTSLKDRMMLAMACTRSRNRVVNYEAEHCHYSNHLDSRTPAPAIVIT